MSTVAARRSNPEIRCLSCPDAIGRAIEKYVKGPRRSKPEDVRIDEEEEAERGLEHSLSENGCPDCGAAIEREGGCIVCRICGFSKCS